MIYESGYVRGMYKLAAVMMLMACGKSADQDKAKPAETPTPSSAPSGAAPVASAPVAAPIAVTDVKACDLITADEVGKIFNKKVIMKKEAEPHSCSFGLDPAEMQKSMEAMTKNPMSMVAKGGMKMPGMDQLIIEVSIARDDQTEEQIKATYKKIGSAAAGVTKSAPNPAGVKDVVTGMHELSGVGDWAFTTNVASVDMGNAMTLAGRLLHARSGAWSLTLSTTISPDPGTEKLDAKMADVARPITAKLKAL